MQQSDDSECLAHGRNRNGKMLAKSASLKKNSSSNFPTAKKWTRPQKPTIL